MAATGNQSMQAGGAAPPAFYANGLQYAGGVGSVRGSTIPRNGNPSNPATPAATTTSDGTYNGPGSGKSFLGEPFAVWLGLVLILFLLKYAGESSNGVISNVSHMRIGGYNFLAVGVTSIVFITLFKVIFNKVKVPGITEFANAA